MVIAILRKEEDKIELEKKDKIILGVISLLEMGLIFIGFYVSWTRAHYGIAEGIQGRYFLPILPLIALLASKNVLDVKIKNEKWKVAFLIIILYIPTIIATIKAYL